MSANRPGCFWGLLRLFLLGNLYDWLQRKVGYGRGGCIGCGCGTLLLIIGGFIFLSIIFGTDWTDLRFSIPSWPVVLLPAMQSLATLLPV